MRLFGLLLMAGLFLTACALPPAVTVAHFVADGVSYVATGKSTTDHAISAVVGEDCSLFRAFQDRAICDPDGEVLIALVAGDPADENWYLEPETGVVDRDAATPWGPPSGLNAKIETAAERPLELADATGKLRTFDIPAIAVPALAQALHGQAISQLEPAAMIAAIAQPAPRVLFARAPLTEKVRPTQITAVPNNQVPKLGSQQSQLATFAVIGSYRVAKNARRLADSIGDARIQTALVDGGTTHRVLIDQPVEQARNAGYADAWPVRLCADDLAVPPCQ